MSDLSKEEQAILDGYLKGASGPSGHLPDQNDRRLWLQKRYGEIKAKWIWYFMQKWEADGVKAEAEVGKLIVEFEKNLKERAWVVTELGKIGQAAEDPFASLFEKVKEEAAIDAYSAGLHAGEEAPREVDYKEYCRIRYDHIKNNYKELLLQKAEAEALKASTAVENISALLRLNFKLRMFIVKNLRKYGIIVDDPFVPLSAT